MRNKEKQISDIKVSEMTMSPNTAVYEDTALDLYPELLINDNDANKIILIKHNYYSSDDEHGRMLLSAFLDVIADESSKISSVFLIDTGVKLLTSGTSSSLFFKSVREKGVNLVICRESAELYEIPVGDHEVYSAHEIALELLNTPDIFIIE